MTAKEFLQQAYFAQQEIEMKLEQITRIQSVATQTTSTIKSTPSGSNATNSKIEKAIISLQERENRLAEEVAELVKINEEVSTAIAKVDITPAEKRILKYRYLCFFSWKQISLLMKMSKSNLFRLHSEALKNFSLHWSELEQIGLNWTLQ